MPNTIDQLRAEISYVPEDGSFVRNRTGRKSIGSVNSNGYRVISVLGHAYNAHRLAWMLHHGEIPDFIDHINQDKADNRLANLRLASPSQNKANTKVRADSTTGLKGVKPKSGKFLATITKDGKRTHLGTFNTALEAHCAYRGASIVMFGEFACH